MSLSSLGGEPLDHGYGGVGEHAAGRKAGVAEQALEVGAAPLAAVELRIGSLRHLEPVYGLDILVEAVARLGAQHAAHRDGGDQIPLPGTAFAEPHRVVIR